MQGFHPHFRRPEAIFEVIIPLRHNAIRASLELRPGGRGAGSGQGFATPPPTAGKWLGQDAFREFLDPFAFAGPGAQSRWCPTVSGEHAWIRASVMMKAQLTHLVCP